MSDPHTEEDLDAVFQRIWQLLSRGSADRHSPFHTPTLITYPPVERDTSPANPMAGPSARTVILRGCDVQSYTLEIHTDKRSAKIGELEANPQLTLHVYDHRHKVQVCLDAQASLHRHDEIANTAWQATSSTARQLYAQTIAPGTPIASPKLAPPADTSGRENFVAIRALISGIAWLELRADGHRRAHFFRTSPASDLAWQKSWLAP